MKNALFWSTILLLFLNACKQEDDSPTPDGASLKFAFAFDENQERLDNFGNPAAMPSGHAAQSPDFNSMSVHYIELVPSQFTMVGAGAVVYEGKTQSAQTGSNFETAIVFDEAVVSGAGAPFLEMDLSTLPPGTYEYLRASVTYQNADIRFNLTNLPAPLPSSLDNQLGTMAGFIGFNTFVKQHQVKNKSLNVNADKVQGFWAFEPQLDEPYQSLYLQYINADGVESGQSPEGATTVVNPLAAFGVTLPQGSCIVTGKLETPLVITGQETGDIQLTLSFSVNNSFEWIDSNANGEWDLDASGQNPEPVVDMGLRGLIVK